MAVAHCLPPIARYRAAVSSVGSRTAGAALASGIADFLDGDWNVERQISDHRTGQAGLFRGRASFRLCAAAAVPKEVRLAGELEPADRNGRVLAYEEQGELRFGGHCGPASRSLLYRELADGSADVRFADGREFYRLDLRSGTWSAAHPCRADRYLVTVTRLGADSFTETWRVSGPAKDYELTTTYIRAGGR